MTSDADRAARYARQLVIPSIGPAGQERLAAARVRVVGASAPAVPAVLYLALGGVGTIWIDDAEPIAPADAGHWVYAASRVGEARAAIAAEAIQARSAFVRVEPWHPDAAPTAVLVLAPSREQAIAAAEEARRAELPAVIAEVDGDGGTVVTIPFGAPCYACSHPNSSAGRPHVAGSAALTVLGAEELIFLLADPTFTTGRRIELTRGVPSLRATNRLAGCGCGGDLAS